MATVWFRSGGSPWRQATVPVSECTRVASAEREFGSAKLFIPRTHEILSTDSVGENGGTLIKIDYPGLPGWYGIQEGPMDQSTDGWAMEATEIGILLKYNDLPPLSLLGNSYTAGEIVKRAFASLTDHQRGGIAPGSFVEGPPLITDYEKTGGTFASVLTELADASGQEWEITEGDGGNFVLNWIAPRGVMYSPVLVEGWDLVNVRRIPDTSTIVRRVRAINTGAGLIGERFAPELADDRLAQTVTIESDETSMVTLEQVAQQYLDRHRYRNVRYTFGVRGHWTRTSVTADAPDMGETGGEGFPLMGGGFILYGGGFPLMGGGGGSGTPGEIDTTYATFAAPAWAIQPGEYLRAILPSAGKSGTSILARVMRVTFGDGYVTPVFTVQEIMPVESAQLASRSYRGQRGLAQPQTVPRLLATVAS